MHPLDGYYFAEDCVFYFNGDPDLVESVRPRRYFEGSLYVDSVALLILRFAMGIITEFPVS